MVAAPRCLFLNTHYPGFLATHYAERQGLDRGAQRGERVLQLMGDVGGEALDRLDAVVERVRHVA